MRPALQFLFFMICFGSFWDNSAHAQSNFRIFPYLQVADQNLVQIRWFSGQSYPASISVWDSKGNRLSTSEVQGKEMGDLYYTNAEKSQTIAGLEGKIWIGSGSYYRYNYVFRVPFGDEISYEVTLGGQTFTEKFKSAPDPNNWENIRFIALSDSETEPLGRVTHRTWYPGLPLIRPFAIPAAWKQKFGTTVEQGVELPNYFLTETEGYSANLEIINGRKPDFMMMPGDLVQGGGYMPAWDEFWRHNSGEFGTGLSSYPIVAAIGNWESYGAINSGYGSNEKGKFNPIVGRSRFHSFFELDIDDALQKHRQSYYRTDYGPITILTLDSSNGTPEEKRTDTPDQQKLKGKTFIGPGTDTQENYTQAQYQAAGGDDLSGFGPGTPQYAWLEANLKEASETKRLIFVQFHHIPFSSGEHGVPMNHELSTGQGGTPLRVLHPLFEKYGVVAVLAGHDELFERSFVDEDQDGKGVQYYDVGVAGDGMRGVKRDWNSNPLAMLDYNGYSQWTADQKSPEQWNTSGINPILTDGGKHYGHLEVNLQKVKDGEKTFAQIDFEPVYAFPVLDQNYNLLRVERRVYHDKLRITVELEEAMSVPDFRAELTVELDQDGKAVTSIQDYLKNEAQSDWQVEFSRSPIYSCEDLAGTENELKIKDSNGNSWSSVVLVKATDTSAPQLTPKTPVLEFDLIRGFLELKVEDFVASLSDNCGIKSLELNKTRIGCDGYESPIELILTAKDFSGNSVSETIIINVTTIESKKISISPESGKQFTSGQQAEIRLGEEFEFTVQGWYRSGQLLIGEKGKAISTDQPGTYWASLIPTGGGCLVESKKTEITFTSLPFDQVKESVVLELGSGGKADLSPQQVFVSWPQADPNLSVSFSKSLFTCEDLGQNELVITIKNQNGETWERKTVVEVEDRTKPILLPRNIIVELDVYKGVAEITPHMLLAEYGDNCGIKSLTISKDRFTCEDAGKEFSVAIRAEDSSGNVSEAVSTVSVTRSEPEKVAVSGNAEICEGEKSVLELSSSKPFEVVRWRRNGVEIQGQDGKSLEVSEPGKYHAVIRYAGACLSETEAFEVKVSPLPMGEIAVQGNILRGPEGNFTYQWFRNGEKIEEATARTFTANQIGEYAVELSNETGCKAMLNAVTLTISGILGRTVNQSIQLRIYPNPASDRVTIELPDGVLVSKPDISIYSSEGKDISAAVQVTALDHSKVEIRLNRITEGTYLIWIVGENQKTYVGKLVVVN